MGLNIPENATEIFNRVAVDISTELNELDPFLRASFIRAFAVGYSNAIFELYKSLEETQKEAFWGTTTLLLEDWAAIWGITRNPATKASGFVTFTGIDTTAIPISTQFTAESGSFYETLAAATITDANSLITSLTRVSNTASAVTSTGHGYASNMEITISGANETDYNGTFVIVVTGLTTFEYTVENNPTTPATGTILGNASFTNVEAESVDFGADQNLESGSLISLASPIPGVDNDGFVSFDEMGGGTDTESDASLRDRFLFRVQNPIALFNENSIIDQAKTVPGVTRVFVQGNDFFDGQLTALTLTKDGTFAAVFETATPHGLTSGQPITVTGANETDYNVSEQKILILDTTNFTYVVPVTAPASATGVITADFGVSAIGTVRIFFVRDNDTNIIPSPSEIDDVKDAVLEIKPITTSSSDVQVLAPIPIITNFTFTSITPDTADMRTAITNGLESFFTQGTSVAEDVTELEYNSVIISTIDNAGNRLKDFTLSSPSGDIAINVSELAVLGTVTFP